MWLGLASILFLVFVTAFFVAVEFALVSARRTRIEQLASEGSATARSVKHALENLNLYLAAAQVGITLATIGLGALGEPVLAEVLVPPLEAVLPHEFVERFVSLHGIALVLALFIVTLLELILGETVPKIAAIQRSVGTSMLLIRPMNFFLILFKPLIWIVNTLSNAVLRLVGLPQDADHSTAYTVEELEMLVQSSRKAGVLDRQEEVILRRVFDFGDLTARQVMRPRTEIEAISIDASLGDVVKTMLEHKHSRFPVYEGDLDNILGVLHVKDVFDALAGAQGVDRAGDGTASLTPLGASVPSQNESAQFSVASLLRPIVPVPETLSIAELLTRMQQGRYQMVAVIDEYGGTAGIITIEDIIEEIVGEMRDEFEPGEVQPGIVNTPDGTLVDGMVAIDDVNETLNLELRSESDTIGGYVFEVLGRKPELGDEITSDGVVLRVEELDGLRISKVRLVPRENAPVRQEQDEE